MCEYQSVECAFTSPVTIESIMLVTCRMQDAMSLSTVVSVVMSCLLVESMCLLL